MTKTEWNLIQKTMTETESQSAVALYSPSLEAASSFLAWLRTRRKTKNKLVRCSHGYSRPPGMLRCQMLTVIPGNTWCRMEMDGGEKEERKKR